MTIRVDLFCEKIQTSIKTFLKFVCLPLYLAIYTDSNSWRKLKVLLGFIWGLFLGFLLHLVILRKLRLPFITELALAAFTTSILALGNAFSVQIRCISFLALPVFCGKAGRNVLKAVIISLVVIGPVKNLSNNGWESLRVFSCSAAFAFDLAKVRLQIMLKPIQKAILGSKDNLEDIKEDVSSQDLNATWTCASLVVQQALDPFVSLTADYIECLGLVHHRSRVCEANFVTLKVCKSVHDMVAPITGEVEGNEVMKSMIEENDYMDLEKKKADEQMEEIKARKALKPTDYEERYKKRMSERCYGQLEKGVNRCKKMFENAYNKCYDTVTFLAAWLLCWPMKLNFVCNLIMKLGGTKACDSLNIVDPGMGEGYDSLKHADENYGKNFKQVRLQIEVDKPKYIENLKDGISTAKMLKNDMETKKDTVDQILYLLMALLSMVFVKIILKSQEYHDAYLTKIYHDNLYVTRYFRKIDARRKVADKLTVLPMRRFEQRSLIDPFSWHCTEAEKTHFSGNVIVVLMQLVLVSTLLLIDHIFVEVLKIVQKHAKVEVTQEGEHELELEVFGTGMLAKLVRTILRGFDVKDHVVRKVDNEKCLPIAKVLPVSMYLKIYGSFLAIILLLLLQAYLLRLRRVICAYFYPKREKRRVLRLYNDSLRKRMTFFQRARREVLITAKRLLLERPSKWSLKEIKKRHPRKFGWLCIFKATRDRCVVCGIYEPILERNRKKEPFVTSTMPYCPLVYCKTCWYDIGQACYICEPQKDDDDEDEDDNEDDDYRKDDSEYDDDEDDDD